MLRKQTPAQISKKSRAKILLGRLRIGILFVFAFSLPKSNAEAINKSISDIVAHSWASDADPHMEISTVGYLKYHIGFGVICEHIDAAWLWDCLQVRRYNGATHPENAHLQIEGVLFSGGLTQAGIDVHNVRLAANDTEGDLLFKSIDVDERFDDQCVGLDSLEEKKDARGRWSPLQYVARGGPNLDGSAVWVGGVFFLA